MIDSTLYKTLQVIIRHLFCLVLVFNVAGKTLVVDLLHESLDLFELCDSGSEEKELDCKEKELEDYDEQKKFFEDVELDFRSVNELARLHYYEHNLYFNIDSSIILPPPEMRS